MPDKTPRCAIVHTVYGYMHTKVQYQCFGYKGIRCSKTVHLQIRCSKTVHLQLHMIRYAMIYWLTAIGLTPGDSSTVHIYTNPHTHTQNTQKNTMKQNTQNVTYIKIRINNLIIRMHNNKSTQFTKLNINIQNIQLTK
jgi:hypothetical protein